MVHMRLAAVVDRGRWHLAIAGRLRLKSADRVFARGFN
jgi:hypothetical protein